jgi:hypothetical protein
MVCTLTDIAEVLVPMEVQAWRIQVQLFLGAMNENRNKSSSIYPWVLHGSWAMGFNPDGLINS